ncbi:Fe-Mn family superoxide dismutase [Paenibacillus sp. SN-8-1]|uniref:Fe-Mn family superoxide dismutase n=1 Tax=Paenibacillus sp. SN-8-1 TaxID=3435409 RepID=UPI003D9AB19C
MLYVYGPYLPVRILEEIRFWKQQEREHTDVIKAIVPTLEQPYVKLLDDWSKVFEETEKAANDLLQHTIHVQQDHLHPELLKQIERLLDASFRQSREWVRQLYILLDQSAAVKAIPLANAVILHIIRESEYFLGVLETLNRPGVIEDAVHHPPHILDPYQQEIEYARGEAASEGTAPEPNSGTGAPENHAELISGASKNDAPIAAGIQDQPVPIGGHKLPPLPYPYNALEPHIDETTMRIHHDKHHQSYVDNLNKAEKKLEEARRTGNFDLVKHWERELAFNGAGHYLHTIYWSTMNPKGGGRPEGPLADQIRRDFGSYEAFQKQFTKAAEEVEGGGWTILVWSPRSHRLEILQAEKHQNLSQWDVVPLLPIDVWEHSYYLKHQNERKKYIADWWKVVYWPEVAARYNEARKLKWQPF